MRLTAIIVTLGDDPRLSACLAALEAASPGDLELVIVENGAHGPPPPLRLEPTLRLRRSANPGFAAAVNQALEVSSGEAVLTLNPDVVLHPDAIQVALATLLSNPEVGAVAFRLLRPGGDLLDSAGIRLGLVRRARDRGGGGPAAGRYLRVEAVDAACMACALFRREALESARDGAGEVLDGRFFAYKEDVDLGWRLRRAGYHIIYQPGARADHERRWRENGRRRIPRELRILSLRNRWLMIAKNEAPLSFLLRLALYIPFELLLLSYILIREPEVLAAWPQAVAGYRESRRRATLRGERR